MEKKNITKFPKGFFQMKRSTITASEALKDTIPIKWKETLENKNDEKVKLVKKNN